MKFESHAYGRGVRVRGLSNTKQQSFGRLIRTPPMIHHDALEFPDGVLLTLLKKHQQATVLQLPAIVADAKAPRRVVNL
jgi:hypothetical protein